MKETGDELICAKLVSEWNSLASRDLLIFMENGFPGDPRSIAVGVGGWRRNEFLYRGGHNLCP